MAPCMSPASHSPTSWKPEEPVLSPCGTASPSGGASATTHLPVWANSGRDCRGKDCHPAASCSVPFPLGGSFGSFCYQCTYTNPSYPSLVSMPAELWLWPLSNIYLFLQGSPASAFCELPFQIWAQGFPVWPSQPSALPASVLEYWICPA